MLLAVILLSYPMLVHATRGCCSWHGGIDHCSSNGYYICNDGTQSPSCTCYYNNTNSNSNNDKKITLTDTSCEYNYNDIYTRDNKIQELTERIETLEDKLENKDNDISNYQLLFFVTLICLIYFILKKKKQKR